MAKKKVIVYGGSFSPPGTHHISTANILFQYFGDAGRLIIVPCGPRPDKLAVNDVRPIDRAFMCYLAFRQLIEKGAFLDLNDLEQERFTPTWQLQERYTENEEIWHAVGTDLIVGGREGKSEIQTSWAKGPQIWRELNWLILKRPGFKINKSDLPPHCKVIESEIPGASSEIRRMIFDRNNLYQRFVTPEVAQYIEMHNLYRGGFRPGSVLHTIHNPLPYFVCDPENPKAMYLCRDRLQKDVTPEHNCIVVVGGDGAMLAAVRELWSYRLPFIGFNTGHYGFLMNNAKGFDIGNIRFENMVMRQLPLLYVRTTSDLGHTLNNLAFNDAWIERASGQTAWIEVIVDGVTRIKQLVADGALVSTAQGSTGYARSMGAPPLHVDSPNLILIGNNVVRPDSWRRIVNLPLSSRIIFKIQQVEKRPVRAYVDSKEIPGDIIKMEIRASNIAAVQILFNQDHDIASKLTEIQFPRS